MDTVEAEEVIHLKVATGLTDHPKYDQAIIVCGKRWSSRPRPKATRRLDETTCPGCLKDAHIYQI